MTEAEKQFIIDQQVENIAKITGGTASRLVGVNSKGDEWEKIEIVFEGKNNCA